MLVVVGPEGATGSDDHLQKYVYNRFIRIISEATFKCGQKSQIMRCRTCSKRRIVRQSAAKIVKLCGEIAAKFP